MVISFPALVCLEATWRHILAYASTRTSHLVPRSPLDIDVGEDLNSDSLSVVHELDANHAAAVTVVADAASESTEVPAAPAAQGPLTASERRARAAALRGLALSRGRRFVAAEVAFTEAARLDPGLDLSRTPGFWSLERAAHEAVIAAYDTADRAGDAAILRARVKSTYRPRPVRPLRGALLHS